MERGAGAYGECATTRCAERVRRVADAGRESPVLLGMTEVEEILQQDDTELVTLKSMAYQFISVSFGEHVVSSSSSS
jgi:hypothetical protein